MAGFITVWPVLSSVFTLRTDYSRLGCKSAWNPILRFSPMWEPTRKTGIGNVFLKKQPNGFSHHNPNLVLKVLNNLVHWFLLFFFSHGAAAIGSSSRLGLLLFSSCYYFFPLTAITLLFIAIILFPLLFFFSCCCYFSHMVLLFYFNVIIKLLVI
jgi:hypothetical protein